MRDDLPGWRSLLFVPVNVERFVAKAATLEVDAVQLDLEDSVPPAEKDAARKLVEAAAPRAAAGGADVVVRINRPLGLAVRDIEAALCPEVTALALPKIESADHVKLLAEHVALTELRKGLPEGHTRFILMVETASAWFEMKAIAHSHQRVVAMTLGGEDFATSVGLEPIPEVLTMPKQAMVIAAASAGILPLGFVGSIAEFKDIERFRGIVRRSKAMGFKGASCIHPAQAEVLNEEFAPRPEEIELARRMVEAYEAAKAEGRGSVTFEGKMIDVPIVERARALITWQDAIANRRIRGSGS